MKEGWNTSTLEELCLFFGDGNWIESKDQSTEGYRLIQTGNIGIGEFKNKSGKEKYINEETFKRLKCTEIFGGDILVSRLPEPVGRTCIIPDLNCKMITAVDCSIVRPNEEKILSNYIKYFTQSKLYFEFIKEKITGTTRDRISRKNLGKIFINYPSLSEQHRIVEILDTAFAKIDTVKQNAERNLQNAKELFQNYLEEIQTQNNDWKSDIIGNVCTLKSGNSLPEKILKIKGEIPYIKVSEMNIPENIPTIKSSPNQVNYSDVSKGIFPIGSVIFPKRGGAIATNKKRLTGVKICADLNIMGVIPKDEILSEYLYYYFLGVDLGKLSNGTTIPQINNGDIAPLIIKYPQSLSEQRQIVSKLDALSAKCKELENNYLKTINDCDELKKAILAKAFNGEL